MTTKEARARFQRGSGCYTCNVCGRKTRSTGRGDNEDVKLCVECYEVAGIENQIADKSFYGDQTEESCIAEIERLNAECRAKGGNV